jgi:uncharacterized protein DUF2834
MSSRTVYLLLCVAGTLLPYSQFVPFALEHGIDLQLFVRQLFANQISRFFACDVIVSSVVLWTFVVLESRRARIHHLWAPIVASLTVGVSLGLPLFLYLRERSVDASRS